MPPLLVMVLLLPLSLKELLLIANKTCSSRKKNECSVIMVARSSLMGRNTPLSAGTAQSLAPIRNEMEQVQSIAGFYNKFLHDL